MTIPRVLHVVPALFGEADGTFGGAERYALELARHMAKVAPTRLVTFGRSPARQRQDDLEIEVFGHPWFVHGQKHNPIALGLFREIFRHDVIHLHQQHVLASSLSALVARACGRRVFVTDLGGGGWDLSAYVSTDRWFHGHLHISEFSRQVYRQANDPRAHVIGGGVDLERFTPNPALPKTAHVLFVGRLMPHKGVNYLIDGLPDGMTLEVVGKAYDPEYFRALERTALGKRVIFRQQCGDTELIQAYQQSLCVVLPSVCRDMYGRQSPIPELLGQTLLEGMACGLPALCTAVGPMPDVVQDGVTGFVVPPNDPSALAERLRWLAAHPEQAREMGTQARQRAVENYSWQAVVQRCLHCYQGTGFPPSRVPSPPIIRHRRPQPP